MLVSVIIPTHNRAGPVCRAIDSVRNQSFKDFELLVIDDGSTDDTERWVTRYADARLSYFRIPRGGVSRARNFGFEKSRGEWIAFLDSDDVWRRHKLSEQIRYHAAHRDILISQTEETWIRRSVRVNKMKKHEPPEGDVFRANLERCLITCSSIMMRRDVFAASGGFDESFPVCEDYELWLRLTARYRVGLVRKPLITKFGGHEDQLSRAFPVMDRFRVRALDKILASGLLSVEQRRWATAERQRKQTIIESGVNKRGRRAR